MKFLELVEGSTGILEYSVGVYTAALGDGIDTLKNVKILYSLAHSMLHNANRVR